MAKQDKEKQRRQKQAKYESEKAKIDKFHQMAPKLEPVLRQVGCDIPFFDYLDSYAEELAEQCRWQLQQFPSLLGIHEVDDGEFQESNSGQVWRSAYRQVFFNIDERFSRYGTNSNSNANMCGSATFFLDDDGKLRSLVQIPRSPKCSFQHKEFKYAFKVGSLLHEIGHIQDAEQRINIDAAAGRFELVQAEAYANCYALERLADRCLAKTYSMLYEGIQAFASSGGYEGEIGRLVLDRHQHRKIRIGRITWTPPRRKLPAEHESVIGGIEREILARLCFKGDERPVEMKPGDFLNIPAPQEAPGRVDDAGQADDLAGGAFGDKR